MATRTTEAVEAGTASRVRPPLTPGRAIRIAVVAAFATAWSAYWALVVRLHLIHGDLAGAAATVVLLVLPALAGGAWYNLRTLGYLDGVVPRLG